MEMMFAHIFDFIQSNVAYAHWIIFGLLLLAGFNLPVSEDGMLFISALIASNYPEQLPHLFTGVFAGAYFSDLICYWLGRKLGPKLWKIRFFAKMVSQDKIATISGHYEKYGIITLIIGRFIPFGVRNGLFLTAGLGKMNFIKFALSDLLACTISTISFFSLYYYLGRPVIEYVKRGNVAIFVAALIVLLIIFVKSKRKKPV